MKLRYTRLRVWAIFTVVVIGVIVALNYSTGPRGPYQSVSPITDSLLTNSYPDLYKAITNRDAQQLKPFLTHEHPEVHDQAWRALANTPVDSLSPFLKLARQQNTETAWFGISKHRLTAEQLRALEKSWDTHSEYRSGIARVLGQQGDEQTLDFLLEQLDNHGLDNEFNLALAVGRLVRNFDTGQSQQIRIVQSAFDTDNYDARRAYLYGWYRGDESRLTSTAQDTLYSRWQVMGTGINREVDQYVNKILPDRTTSEMTIYYNGEQMLDNEVQLSYELATSIGKVDLNDRNSLAAKILLTNANPHVQVRTLRSLSGKISRQDDLFGYINDTMLADTLLADAVWLQALETALTVDSDAAKGYEDRLKDIPGKNVYLLPEVLAVYQEIESTNDYLKRISAIISEGKPRPGMFALRSLNQFWDDLAPRERTQNHVDTVRDIVFEALELGDRGVAYTVQSLLQREDLFGSDDFDRINRSLSAFSLPGDIEVYQSFGSLYKDRFEEQAKAVIDSLASLNYAPLNRSLADAGWKVKVPEKSETGFRALDWQRLWELGRNPVFTLRTEKGPVEMELNTLSAPATVAMVDSLNQAQLYEGVPFHRVVPNFVVQGGDYDRKDGFGGPNFVIPTEASEKGFVRGAVGIASAGPDTEGSQYFIMHQWKPHLNGSYTRFGHVREGLDVVDEIMEGDKVLSTTWY